MKQAIELPESEQQALSDDPDSSSCRCQETLPQVPHLIRSEERSFPAGPVRTCSDDSIESLAVEAIRWVTTAPEGGVRVSVQEAWITLEGEVDCPPMKAAAEHAVRHIDGVVGITNLISVVPGAATIRPTARPRLSCLSAKTNRRR
jgi:hypothetical protein